MADLSITAANVKLADAGGNFEEVQYGETVTQGQPVYKKAADGKYWKADADASATAVARGIVYSPGAADGYGLIAKDGTKINLGATLVVGTTYVVSATAGGIAPEVDLASGDYVTHLGIATTSSSLTIDINVVGVAKP